MTIKLFFQLAIKSLLSRKGSVFLTFAAICVSVFVLLAIEHARVELKQNFNNTVSGVDLIAGARTGEINLLLYSIFRIGNATQNIGWKSYQQFSERDDVAWSIPISLGDSHKGYRVVGTTPAYFSHYRYAQRQPLAFAKGQAFDQLFDVVLGAEVAKKLGYDIGSKVVLAHGIAKNSFSQHDDNPFKVVGILEPTGTPVDQSLHVSLAAIEAIHVNWQNGVKLPGKAAPDFSNIDLTPKTITAFMLGLKNKITTFRVQREINNYGNEALLAIIPGVTLSQLWQIMSGVEKTLALISLLVLLAALLGLAATLLTAIRERTKEIAVLRAIGVSPIKIFLLIQLEALLIAFSAVVTAVALLTLLIVLFKQALLDGFGLVISSNIVTTNTLLLCGLVLVSTLLIALIPAISAYRAAIHSRLTS